MIKKKLEEKHQKKREKREKIGKQKKKEIGAWCYCWFACTHHLFLYELLAHPLCLSLHLASHHGSTSSIVTL